MLKSIASATLAIALVVVPASAATTINVKLWDKGSGADMATNRGIGMSGDMSAKTMGVDLSVSSVKAGDITFKVVNSSQETIHEMVVFPYKDGEKIPFSEKDAKIDEDQAGHLGEVSELDPSKNGALTLNLKPGKYVLTCNIPGHYMNGMWAILTVK
jgi:uncharacterized cupredoxin-like copper-binding protein